MIAINAIAVENELADNMYQRSEYDDLILNVNSEKLLKAATVYRSLKNDTARGSNPAGGKLSNMFLMIL